MKTSLIDMFSEAMGQPALAEGPLYYETLPKFSEAIAHNDVRDKIDFIVREHTPHAVLRDYPELTGSMIDELTRLVNSEILDKADQIVYRLQRHTEGA